MYMLGSYIVTKYSGASYADFVTERIFRPLNMSSSSFWTETPVDAWRGLTAQSEAHLETTEMTGYWKNGRLVPPILDNSLVSLNAGPGGVVSNAVDMGKWTLMLLNKGVDPVTQRVIIPDATFAEITSPHVVMDMPVGGNGVAAYGEGWWQFAYGGREVVQHGGAVPGLSTLCTFLPVNSHDSGVAVTVLVNTDNKNGQAGEATSAIVRAALGILDSSEHTGHLNDITYVLTGWSIKVDSADLYSVPILSLISLEEQACRASPWTNRDPTTSKGLRRLYLRHSSRSL